MKHPIYLAWVTLLTGYLALSNARLMVMGGAPMDGPRHGWWNFVSSRKGRIDQAAADWRAARFDSVPGETEVMPLA